MPTSEIKKDARKALTGKWGKAILIILAFSLISFCYSFLSTLFNKNSIISFILDIAWIVISIPLTFGLIISFIKLKRNENVSAFDFLKDGFSRFNKSWGIWFQTFIRLILPIICIFLIAIVLIGLYICNSAIMAKPSYFLVLVILSVILYLITIVYLYSRTLLYAMSYFISYDNPELSSKEVVLKSESMMKGNRGNLFLLQLSFIGWAFLACLTLGIGFLWLIPYIQVSIICFYEKLVKPNVTEVEGTANIKE